MSRLRIPYTDRRKFDVEPMPAWGIHKGQIFFRCACGSIVDLTMWSVDNTGNVNPSIDHSEDPTFCTFHEFVQFEDWAQHKGEQYE